MPNSLPDSAVSRHLLPSEKAKARMAKVETVRLRKAENAVWQKAVGKAIERVRQSAGLTLEEFAYALKKDDRQVSRWIDGKEHAQIAALFAVERFQILLVIALAELANLEIFTDIRIRRRA